ncbi:hypothetical protein QYF36_023417 [Acer negundo]|nr:hypothetical protein QYF36_023417 [Acer negundo]
MKEMRRKSQGLSQSEILVIEKRGRSKSRGLKNRDRSKSKSNRFANVECYHCGQKRQIKKYCQQLKRDHKNEKGKEKKTDDSNDGDRVFAITDDFLVVCDDDDDVVNLACHELDIKKTDKIVSQYHDDLIDLDPVPLTNVPVQVRDEVQDYHDGTVDADTHTQVEIDDDIHEQSPVPEVPLKMSTRDHQPSTWYSVDDITKVKILQLEMEDDDGEVQPPLVQHGVYLDGKLEAPQALLTTLQLTAVDFYCNSQEFVRTSKECQDPSILHN